MKTVAIIQARLGSQRFPRKVLKPINGTPLIEILISRLARSTQIDEIVLATSDLPINQPLADHVSKLGYRVYRGSEFDVLDRFYQAAKLSNADTVVRITGDCPLIDPEVVDSVVELFKANPVDYASNAHPPIHPDGLDTEVFSFQALEEAWTHGKDAHDREHVTPYIEGGDRYRMTSLKSDEDFSDQRWTVDEPADLVVVQAIFEHFHPRTDFGWREVIKLLHEQPQLFTANKHLIRNEGATMGTGQKLWKRAKNVIPGGNMLLSKRSEMYLPDYWPSYFSKASGCRVWDLDGNEYVDMSIMGVGTNSLGYGHPEVDDAVRQTVANGNMSTLNCPEEVYLAEKLVEMHPWADMARFTRGGGEANSVAIRIARAASGREKVAICGYHGWHDWYLAANLGDDTQLAGHLLPGLEPKGVPTALKGTILPFNYNRFDELLHIVNNNDIGVIKMEVARNFDSEDNFLQKVRDLATERNIVLIFDECTSGFRQTYGGLHLQYGIEPDMAMFGKALGNGYAIAAVIGRREVMQAAQSTFISSTFWTERIGPTAALKTLEVMAREKSWEKITAVGQDITERWNKLADKHGVKIATGGLAALTGFSFSGPNGLAYKTLMTQEMLAKGYLASTCVYVSTAHTPDIVDKYFEDLDPVFALIKACDEGREKINLKGPVCHDGFKRLN